MEFSKILLRKGKLMFPQVVLLATLFSCTKDNIQDTTLQDSTNSILANRELVSAVVSNNFVYEETFEGSNPLGTYVSKQFATTHAFSVVSSPVFQGSKAGKIELRDSDPLNNNGTRAEISFPYITNNHRWYSFSIYFPLSDYAYDSQPEVITQWHQGGGMSPAIAVETVADKYRLTVRPTPTTKDVIDLGAITKNAWNTFVFHIKHDGGSAGLLEVWINGVKKLTRTGDNYYTTSEGSGVTAPKWKVGIYKWDWNGDETTDTKKRILYLDNIRMGNENATYAEMTGGATTTPTPTPDPTPTPTPDPTPTTGQQITGFVLVNSGTEKDVQTITNGSTIRLSSLGISKINIRAISNPSTVGSVKFELSGQESKTYTDNAAPYALHGDDGNGNFYYGNWNPPAAGTYTLKATPYSGSKATGTAGKSYSITFTIAK